jgi:VanZ family protein
VADKVMQFLVLGALLALAFRPSGARGWAVLLAAAGLLAVFFEAGQLFLPTRYTSLTDVLVETASAGLGLTLLGFSPLQATPFQRQW